MATDLLESLQQQIVPAAGAATLSHGCLVFSLAPEELMPTVRRLKEEFGYDLFLDVTAVDWPADALRFEVVHHFASSRQPLRVRLKTLGSAAATRVNIGDRQSTRLNSS